jgi:hypothetical protein
MSVELMTVLENTVATSEAAPSPRPVPKKIPTKNRHTAFTLEGKTNIDKISITTEHGIEEVSIPALPRTNYWGILKCMYLNHDKRISHQELCSGVESLMRDEPKWERFVKKTKVKTVHGFTERSVVEQAAKTWQQRLVSNARNLCRIGGNNAYGKRLMKQGHVMRYETDLAGNSYFILYTVLTESNMSARRRGRKPYKKTVETGL